jgi:hypothetical protein
LCTNKSELHKIKVCSNSTRIMLCLKAAKGMDKSDSTHSFDGGQDF